MPNKQFAQWVDDTLLAVEEAIEELETDIDPLPGPGLLKLVCENGTQIILSRQPAVSQLWVAAKRMGYHFDMDLDENVWRCDKSGRTLGVILSEVFTEQAEISVDMNHLDQVVS